jgi:4-amino-4-deoxy-L-arabinose transferase-like glycosyltransferase
MTEAHKNLLFLVACSVGLFLVSLLTRSLIPVDETRYTSVAWEMWLRGDYLVPHLNGATYSHKPPLLFWLFMLGWQVFGVNEWWPRVIPLLFSLGSLYLVHVLARQLWPARDVHLYAPVILLGFTIWLFFSTAVMFDMMLAFFVMLAIYGMVRALSGDGRHWWYLTGLAWGLGMLAKGPVIFVHTLPILLLVRVWVQSERAVPMGQMVKGFLTALVMSVFIILAWVIPALLSPSGGWEDYGRSLLLGQNIERALKAPNDALAWWYYLPVLPFLLFPWFYWGGVWKSLFCKRDNALLGDRGVRFSLVWSVSVIIIFSLISGKKVHYLLPILPAIAMLFGAAMDRSKVVAGRGSMLVVTFIYVLIAIGMGYAAMMYPVDEKPYWLANVSNWAWLPFLLLAMAGIWLSRGTLLSQARLITLQSMLLLAVLHFTVFVPAMQGYGLKDISLKVRALQEKGMTVAHVGKYQDEFHFLGRLEQPLVLLHEAGVPVWLGNHPDAYVISYRYIPCGQAMEPAMFMRLYRNGQCVTLRTSVQQKEYLKKLSDNAGV